MAEPGKHQPEAAGFERQDLSPRGVYVFLVGLAAVMAVVAVLLWVAYHAMDAYESQHQPSQSPLVPQTQVDTRQVSPGVINAFPQPRLERNERLEINEFRLREEQALESYGWVDQKAGVARIPIDRAMQLIAQRGLPTTPKTGSVPPSEVNVVNQAVQGADNRQLRRSKGKKQ
jgi:hypothetical protein